jgi:hypothetical protein
MWDDDDVLSDAANDAVLQYMLKHGIPISRKAYLELAYMGDVPELDAELESELPEIIQRIRPESTTTQ